MNEALRFVIETFVGEFILVIFGVLVANRIQTWWRDRKFGKWSVVVTKNGETLVDRPVSSRKTQEVLDEEADLAVFLKGIVSPYGYINCDLITQGKECGLLEIDHTGSKFIVNLDNNPPQTNQRAAT